MAFEWQEYLGLAQELLTQPSAFPPGQEAKLRASASRAYYAAFCLARNWQREHGAQDTAGAIRVEGSHQEVINRYRRQGHRQFWAIATNLGRLREVRVQADYNDVVSPRFPTEVAETLLIAQSLIGAISSLNPAQFDPEA